MFSFLYVITIQVREKLYVQVQLIVFMHIKIIFNYLVTHSLMGSLSSSLHRMDAANSDILHYTIFSLCKAGSEFRQTQLLSFFFDHCYDIQLLLNYLFAKYADCYYLI